MRDRRDVKDGIVVCEGVVARVVAERSLAAHLVRIDIALKDDLRRRGHLKIDRNALHEFDRFMPEEPRKDHLVDVARQRCRRRIGHDGIRADGDGRLDAFAALRLHRAEVLRSVLVDMPVHPCRAAVVLLQAIHTDVALARLGILRKDERQRHKGAAVIRPALQNGDLVEIWVLRLDDFLTWCIFHVLWEIDRLARHRDERHEVHLVLQGDVRNLEDLRQLICHVVELLHAEGECHALVAAERIHEDGHLRALYILKEQGNVLRALALRDAIRDLRDLELRVNLRRDAAEQSTLLKCRDVFAQILICQGIPS